MTSVSRVDACCQDMSKFKHRTGSSRGRRFHHCPCPRGDTPVALYSDVLARRVTGSLK